MSRSQEAAMDTAATARHARFGKLPERVRYEDMTEVVQSGPSGAVNASPENVAAYRTLSCLALDLGL
ncbi:hypothetical protein [Streptomyces sp. YU58]|uniref:hypothetical protein n=1 Tax=Streptomyces sp. SX92 TaxID=3158972 RepID=UPI0027BA9556|nr:hypothetical protein [Streptomyces coralus]WLW58134.1 hypothetical protein QU709_45220 [Streptomyces coralus]